MEDKHEKSDQKPSAEVDYSPFLGEEGLCKASGPCACCRRCCFKGYFWGVVGAVYFFIIIPAGVLLILHGHHRSMLLTVVLGSVLLFVFTCVVPLTYIGLRTAHRRRQRRVKQERASMHALKEKAAFVNDSQSIDNSPTLDA